MSIKLLGTEKNPAERSVIALINQMGFIGGIATMILACTAILMGTPIIYSIMSSIFGISILLTLVLNFYNHIQLSKLIVAGLHPMLVSVYIVLSGGSFGEESILIVSLFMIFILYRKDRQVMLRLYINGALFYLCAEVYTFLYPPLFGMIDIPYDNFISFAVSTTWLLMIIQLYRNQVIRQQSAQDKLIQELQEKNANLKKTSEELEQFTYIASHDLKSPLRTIISFLDLIKRDVKRERYDDLLSKLEFARGGAEQMNYLVTDILEYSKITNGTQRKKKMINLQTLADKVKFNLMEFMEKKKVDLYIFPLPDFYCNETEMTVLFQNFIENGIKYNEESTPTIFVKSSITEEELTLQFIDNGIGIEEQYFEKIFLFFKRLHTNDYYKGTGLGLGLCKKIIDDMQGTISVQSTINVGSTFTISLPVENTIEKKVVNRTLVEVS